MIVIEPEMMIILIIVFVVAPIIKIIDKALTKRWKQDLMDFEIAKEVITIYRNYKKNEVEKTSWLHQRFENLKAHIHIYFEKRRQIKNDRLKYGV